MNYQFAWCLLSCLAAADARRLNNVMDDTTIRTAVAAWLSDRAAAEAAYGHISTWDTSGVTGMEGLFNVNARPGAASFNEDISAWDTSGVTSMINMFYYASAFNENIGAWDTSGVTTMDWMFGYASAFNGDIGAWDTSGVTSLNYMFYSASAFDQDLDWCVDDGVYLDYAFYGTPCESTSCGVKLVAGGCAPTRAPTTSPAPTPGALGSDGATARSVALCLAVAALLVLV